VVPKLKRSAVICTKICWSCSRTVGVPATGHCCVEKQGNYRRGSGIVVLAATGEARDPPAHSALKHWVVFWGTRVPRAARRVSQNRVCTPYTTIYLVISLP